MRPIRESPEQSSRRPTILELMIAVAVVAAWLTLIRYPLMLLLAVAATHTLGLLIWAEWTLHRPVHAVFRGPADHAASLFGYLTLGTWVVVGLLVPLGYSVGGVVGHAASGLAILLCVGSLLAASVASYAWLVERLRRIAGVPDPPKQRDRA